MFHQFNENSDNPVGSFEIFQSVENWYWQACFPGCLPDGDAFGPFNSYEEAYEDAQNP